MKLGVLCYVSRNGKTLFVHRTKKENNEMKDQWIGLGGKVDKGESPHESIIREVKEESGLIIVPKLRAIVSFLNSDNERDDWYAYLFTAKKIKGRIIDSTEGDLHWLTAHEINKLNLLKGDRLLLGFLKKNRFFAAKFEYKGNELIRYNVLYQ